MLLLPLHLLDRGNELMPTHGLGFLSHRDCRRAEPGVTFGAMRNESEEVLVYLAAVPVSPGAPMPEDMTAWDVPAGLHAVFEFPFCDIGRAYPFIFGTWLPGSTHQQDARPVLERYGADFSPDQPTSPMQVHVPLRLRV